MASSFGGPFFIAWPFSFLRFAPPLAVGKPNDLFQGRGHMLELLQIQNLALIENLDLAFGPGLNVLSGETGAGKSIIIKAVNLLLGNKATAEVIRQGTEEATRFGPVSTGSPRLSEGRSAPPRIFR